MKILITCPPMIRSIKHVAYRFHEKAIDFVTPEFTQTMSEAELIALVPDFDGWIIGDDPATRSVFEAGIAGKLKACVKWGVGIDNVDMKSARDLGIPITNTPGMFGNEVADIAMGYVIALARQTFAVHQGVLDGKWLKPVGNSLAGKTVALVGFGDIGRQTAKRLTACGMKVIAYDPSFKPSDELPNVENAVWPDRIEQADFVVLTCALNNTTHHMLNQATIAKLPTGVRVINVSRGPLIDEDALVESLGSGHVASAALEVAEIEPLPLDSPLRRFPQVLYGSHNASNTVEAVVRTSELAISSLFGFLEAKPPIMLHR